MEVVILEGKRNLKISIDIDGTKSYIENIRNDYEDEQYVWYGTSPESGESGFKYISKEEFNANTDKFINAFLSYVTENALKKIMSTLPRKKNGMFNRRDIEESASCDSCIVIHEWHNTWIYYIIKVAAWDDITLKIELFKKTDTPC